MDIVWVNMPPLPAQEFGCYTTRVESHPSPLYLLVGWTKKGSSGKDRYSEAIHMGYNRTVAIAEMVPGTFRGRYGVVEAVEMQGYLLGEWRGGFVDRGWGSIGSQAGNYSLTP
eukprot:764143-Hanusia_phi.AAC.4